MMNHIWNKVYNFLNELRCENKSESIVVQLENCSKEKDILESKIRTEEQKETSKKLAGLKSALEKVKAQEIAIDTKLQQLETERASLRTELAETLEKYKDNEQFQYYQQFVDTGIDLARLTYNEMRQLRRDLQIIFQDPYSSLNPRMTIGQIIEEGLVTHKFYKHGSENMKEYILKVMNDCGLQGYMIHRYPHQFSGGQRPQTKTEGKNSQVLS